MVQAEYKHPKYSTDQADTKTVLDQPAHKIVRMKFPDGVIVIFDMDGDTTKVQSNYDFLFDQDTNTIFPKLDSPNKKFQDVI